MAGSTRARHRSEIGGVRRGGELLTARQTATGPSGGVQGGKTYLAPHPSNRQGFHPRREEITTSFRHGLARTAARTMHRRRRGVAPGASGLADSARRRQGRVDKGTPDARSTAWVPNTRQSSLRRDHGSHLRAGHGRDRGGGALPLKGSNCDSNPTGTPPLGPSRTAPEALMTSQVRRTGRERCRLSQWWTRADRPSVGPGRGRQLRRPA